MDLTFQVPMQYCSLQHQTLLPSLVTSTTGHFCFGSVSSFFLELFLHSSPVAYWAPTDLVVHRSVSYLFVFSYCSWGSQGKNKWSSLPFPSPVDLVAQMVKCLPTMWETQVRSLVWEDPLEKEMATHSSIHAWKVPWTEEPGRLQPTGLQKVGHN